MEVISFTFQKSWNLKWGPWCYPYETTACQWRWYLTTVQINTGWALIIMHALTHPASLLFPLRDTSLSCWQGSSGFPGFPGANGEKGARVRKHTHSLSTHTLSVCVWKSPRHHIPAQKKIDSYYKGICMVTWQKKITAAKSMLGREQKTWRQSCFHWAPLPRL